ncbi:hemocyanin AA6 chain [Trichonephila clavipes]|nr:hemocyanin AA6 chain [Trichonephila clavipes]
MQICFGSAFLRVLDITSMYCQLLRVKVNPGLNTIVRSSRDSSVTISTERKFEQLLKGEGTTEHSTEYCSCGWPNHLLIPKGNDKGMDFHLFVMVTDHLSDLVGQLTDKNICTDAVSYCGVKDPRP